MSEFKGTKGKWKPCTNWDDEFIEIGTSENQNIALVNKAYINEFEANAKLISCAPEILYFIESLLKESDDIVNQEIKKEAIELIKKATE